MGKLSVKIVTDRDTFSFGSEQASFLTWSKEPRNQLKMLLAQFSVHVSVLHANSLSLLLIFSFVHFLCGNKCDVIRWSELSWCLFFFRKRTITFVIGLIGISRRCLHK